MSQLEQINHIGDVEPENDGSQEKEPLMSENTTSTTKTRKTRSTTIGQIEEEKFASALVQLVAIGHMLSRQTIIEFATELALLLGKRTSATALTMSWYKKFSQRWPEVKLLKEATGIRVKKNDRPRIASAFCTYLDGILGRNDLLSKPHLIYNICVVTGTKTSVPPLTLCSLENTIQGTLEDELVSDRTSVFLAVSASGEIVPPYFVFEKHNAKVDKDSLLVGAVPKADCHITGTGLPDAEALNGYLHNHFKKFLPARDDEPVIVVVDGSKSHVVVSSMEWLTEYNIRFCFLPEGTSEKLQPLAVCFEPLLKAYCEECRKYLQANNKSIASNQFCSLFSSAFEQVLTPDRITEAFAKTGIFPQSNEVLKSIVNQRTTKKRHIAALTANVMDKEIFDSYDEEDSD